MRLQLTLHFSLPTSYFSPVPEYQLLDAVLETRLQYFPLIRDNALNTGKVKKSIAAFVAATYLFMMMVSAVELVLCIEPDGSMSVEYAENGVCISFSDAKAESSSIVELARLSVPSNSDCGACIDISLGAGELDEHTVVHGTASPTGPYLVTESRLDVAEHRAAQPDLPETETAFSIDSTLSCLRTVCLLT